MVLLLFTFTTIFIFFSISHSIHITDIGTEISIDNKVNLDDLGTNSITTNNLKANHNISCTTLEVKNFIFQNPVEKKLITDFSGNFGSYTPGVYGNAVYYKDVLGRVYLEGMVGGTCTGSTTTMFTIPPNYRPDKTMLFATIGYENGANPLRHDVSILINSGGVVTFIDQSGTGVYTWISLNSISFIAYN